MYRRRAERWQTTEMRLRFLLATRLHRTMLLERGKGYLCSLLKTIPISATFNLYHLMQFVKINWGFFCPHANWICIWILHLPWIAGLTNLNPNVVVVAGERESGISLPSSYQCSSFFNCCSIVPNPYASSIS